MGGSPGRGPSQWCGSNLLQKGTKKGLSPIWDFLFRMILNALVVENESQCAGLYGRNTVIPKKHNEKHRCDGLRPASGGAKRRYGLDLKASGTYHRKKKLVTSRAPRARVKCSYGRIPPTCGRLEFCMGAACGGPHRCRETEERSEYVCDQH